MSAAKSSWTDKPMLISVLYPGTVQNYDNALRNLGGIKNISKAFCKEEKSLKLNFHPKSLYSKVAMSESQQKPMVVFSIKERRSKRDPTKPPKIEVNIVGRCVEQHKFNSCTDIQELPLIIKLNTDDQQQKSLVYELAAMPENVHDSDFFDNTNGTLFTLPNLFIRPIVTDTSLLTSKNDTEQETIMVTQKNVNAEKPQLISFNMNDKFPTEPEVNLARSLRVKQVNDEQINILKELFEKCPIWTRIALQYETNFTLDRLKSLLPAVAYYFTSGPWRATFVRYGYDPRIDFSSRDYQIFDFRLRFRSGFTKLVPNRKESVKRKNLYPPGISDDIVQDIDYPYLEEGRLPRARQCMLRYCDVRVRKVQEMLEKIPTPMTGAVCNEKTGWLPIGFDAQVRQVLSKEIMEIMQQYYRQKQKNIVQETEELELVPGDNDCNDSVGDNDVNESVGDNDVNDIGGDNDGNESGGDDEEE